MAEQVEQTPTEQNQATQQANVSAEERLVAFLDKGNAPPDEQQTETEQGAEAPSFSPEESETEQEPEQKVEQETEPDTETEEEEGISLSTLGELAEHVGVEVADLYNITIPITGPDGAKQEVTLGEWKDGYQANEQVTKLQRELAEQKESLATHQQQLEAQYHKASVEAASIMDATEKQLMSEFQAINWDDLRIADPAQWAAKRQEFNERQNQIRGMRHQAALQYEQAMSQSQAQQEQNRQLHLKEQAVALADAIPEWRNDEVAAPERAKLAEYLRDVGYTDAEIDKTSDHRVVVMARKAMMWDAQSKQTDVAKKKVVKIGKKVLKPGAKQSKAQIQQDQTKKARARLRKSGSLDDFVSVYEQAGLK